MAGQSGKPQVRIKDRLFGIFEGGGVAGVAKFIKDNIEGLGARKVRKAVRELGSALSDEAAEQVAALYKTAFPRAGGGRGKGSATSPTLKVSKQGRITATLPAGFATPGAAVERVERVVDGRRAVLLLGPAVGQEADAAAE